MRNAEQRELQVQRRAGRSGRPGAHEGRRAGQLPASRGRGLSASVEALEAGRIDQEVARKTGMIEDAEAKPAEWDGTVDTDAALDYYSRIRDVVDGKLQAAEGVKAMNAALSTVLSEVRLGMDDDGTLHAEFALTLSTRTTPRTPWP